MRHYLHLLLLCFTQMAYGQDMDSLNKNVGNTSVADLKMMLRQARNIFPIDTANEPETMDVTELYPNTRHPKSATAFFANLRHSYPDRVEPYLLSAKYEYYKEGVADTGQITMLRRALAVDSNNLEAHAMLGNAYYVRFHNKQGAWYATQSRTHFIRTTQLNSTATAMYRYLIVQLSNFLNDPATAQHYENLAVVTPTNSAHVPLPGTWYFPMAPFMNLAGNWATDYSQDLLSETSNASFLLNWYSGHLHAMREPLISPGTGKTTYRFTWLRSFHTPVAIRLEKNENSCTLYWKMTDGAGGYGPGRVIVNQSKLLKPAELDSFMNLLHTADFWNMPTKEKNRTGSDGAQWIMEGLEEEKYHIVDRWTPRDNDYEKCAHYLISLTDLKLKPRDIY